MRYELLDLIAGLRVRDDLTVLLTTHYLDEAERLCDRIGIMHDGRIVALGSPASLLAGVGDAVIELRTSSERDARQVLSSLRAHDLAGDDVYLRLTGERIAA
jgi:ABC-2 type transport system ATP-binding protein